MGKVSHKIQPGSLKTSSTNLSKVKLSINIFESTLRLFFDLLHGIKRMDVPLVMVVEFIILLGFDGQLEQSDLEKELFTSAIDQLKERFNRK